MTLSPRNDQKFIESVMLYENNIWTPIDRVCENLCKLADNRLIPKSCSLSELSVESITKFLKDMDKKDSGVIQKDQKFIRSVIFYEFLIGEKDKNKLYKKLRRNIGSYIIDYSVFLNWYDRFKNGYFGIDDASLDTESPTFFDLPMDVIGIIVEKLELKEQLSVRKVSSNLRSLVDKQKPAYKTIRVLIEDDYICVKFNDEYAVYCYEGVDLDSHKTLSKQMPKTESCDYMEIAFDDVAIAMKDQKLQLELFKFCYLFELTGNENVAKFWEKMGTLLGTLNHKISIKEFSIMTNQQDQLMPIPPYLNPGILEVIEVRDDSSLTTNFDIDELAVLDQWKYAKSATIHSWISSSIDHFLHFDHFIIRLHSVTTADLIQIRDEILTSSKFHLLDISYIDMPSIAEIERIFGLPLNAQHWRVYHSLIPNSNEFFELSITDWSISIARKSR